MQNFAYNTMKRAIKYYLGVCLFFAAMPGCQISNQWRAAPTVGSVKDSTEITIIIDSLKICTSFTAIEFFYEPSEFRESYYAGTIELYMTELIMASPLVIKRIIDEGIAPYCKVIKKWPPI